MIKARILKEAYQEIEPITDGRYYVRALIEETDYGIVLTTETVLDHYPSEEELRLLRLEAGYEKSALDSDRKKQAIELLKQELESSDYKVIKNSEWAEKERLKTGNYPTSGFPYDPETLYTERQAIRDKINEYEND